MRQGQDRAFARYLRKNSTDAERILWRHIRAKQIHGFRFRRQVQIGAYFADFVCLEARLVVEVDGGQHNERETDAIRDRCLADAGFEVLRIWNNEVLGNIDGVLETISAALLKSPPPPAGEG